MARPRTTADALDVVEIAEAEERHIRLLLMREELRQRQGAERRQSLVLAMVVALTIGAIALAPQGAILLTCAWLALAGRLLVRNGSGVRATPGRSSPRT